MAKVQEAQEILQAMGLPPAQHNEMAGYTLLALCRLGPRTAWAKAQRESVGVTKGVMDFVATTWKKNYAPNTRETFRRFVLHQFVQARVADYNPDNPTLPTNSPKAHYAITPEALRVVQAYGTRKFAAELAGFKAAQGSLTERYAAERAVNEVPVALPDGKTLRLSPGDHNLVEKAVIEQFAPRYAKGARVLYVGDTAHKEAFIDAPGLEKVGFPANRHDKLPDVVLHMADKGWLFLIEVATSHGPVTPKRKVELEAILAKAGGKAGPVFVSAFPDMAEFRRWLPELAWETEVWVADTPKHLIHFNGDRFMGPRE